MVDEYCADCKYFARSSTLKTCDYLVLTKNPRGCPAGQGCDKKSTNKKEKRKIIIKPVRKDIMTEYKKEREKRIEKAMRRRK